jgi:hypothetical protein
MVLSRDSILAVSDLPVEEVQVPEWGGSVFVRSMNGLERAKLEAFGQADLKRSHDKQRFRQYVACLLASDESGNRLFTDDDLELLAEKSGSAVDRIAMAGMKLNKYTSDDIEELEGN